MIGYRIFVVDDEKTIRDGLVMGLEQDYAVDGFANAEDAVKAMKEGPPDLILLDIGLPGMSGLDAIPVIKEINPDVIVIIITAYEDISTVITAMKLGAYDYVVKPIHLDGLEVSIVNALETVRIKREVQDLQERYLKENVPFFIGESNAIQDVMEFVGKVAKSPDTPILICGETGTGKELIANAIHYRSPNFKGPLIALNCAAVPKDLVESELFGYEKGAFSGAKPEGKKGLIEEADHGTLFLDEVGDLSYEAQAKMLRFLQEGNFYRIGGTRPVNVKVRVISATNKDLDSMIAEESFRKDLYFRLSVIKVALPSLRERTEDLLPLAIHFLSEFSGKFGKKVYSLSKEAQHVLLEHSWTGNIRELRNYIERAVLICEGDEITLNDLGLVPERGKSIAEHGKSGISFAPLSEKGIDLLSAQTALERYYIEEAYRMSGGNESKAAKLLNVNHHTFRYRRKKILEND